MGTTTFIENHNEWFHHHVIIISILVFITHLPDHTTVELPDLLIVLPLPLPPILSTPPAAHVLSSLSPFSCHRPCPGHRRPLAIAVRSSTPVSLLHDFGSLPAS
ncbi:hypothetical protein RIF29_38548 [Crotalaria pallida]|uniref:Uncharacterized protein n=1 Tax=Crotalaria pallida TaxID=3830 RepID=A0AAN9HPT5_CROPI